MEKAFIRWYADAAFGAKDTELDITDGPSDGGIDAIVTVQHGGTGRLTYVLQSKFTRAGLRGRPPPLHVQHYRDFDALPPIFGSDDDFDVWLASVDTSLHDSYRRLRERIRRSPSRVIWKLITLFSRSRAGENRLVNLDPGAFEYSGSILQLFEMQAIGATPPAEPMDLSFTESMTVTDENLHLESYVLAARMRGFLDYLKNDPEFRLLARNVRDDLDSDINADIRDTFRTAPEEFWYSHNGIFVVCSKASIHGKKIRLVNPSVVNGAQTLHALKTIRNPDPNGQVLTRVLVLPPEEDGRPTKPHSGLLDRVIFRTNQQNWMNRYNLRANDSVQVWLAGELVKRKVFYERKQGEWNRRRRLLRNQGLARLTAVQLAQVLASCMPQYGPAVAKQSRDDLFTEPLYDEIFNLTWEHMYLRYRLWDFMNNVFYTLAAGKQSRKKRHTWLTCVAILHGLVTRSRYEERLLSNLDFVEQLNPWNPKCKKITRLAKEILGAAWAAWKRENRRDRSVSPNNFFKNHKRNDEVIRALTRRYRLRIDAAVRPMVEAR